MAAIKFTDATKAYPRTIAPAGKYPIVGDRIYATLKDAQDYVDGNSSSKSAIPGITLSVISDGENNGAYWVAQAAGYENATKGILIKYSQGGETSSTLACLLDVQVSSPSNGQALVYDSVSGMWMNKTIENGNDITSQSIISALGYTPFDSDAFTKANIKNALGIKDWALASSKPSYTFAEITSKPTTLSGYGITNAILYEGAIDLSSAYRSMGYGHASKGWRTSGPAVVFGDTSYNLAMQCAIANADYVSLYVRNKYNGVEYGWDRIVTEGLLSRGAISFDTSAYKCLGDIVIHRNSESGDTYLNYGVANTDKANLRVFGYNISFCAGEASAYNTYLSLYAGGTAQFFVPLTITANLTVTGDITASGNSSSKNFPQGKAFSQDPTSAFITTMFDADAVGDTIYRMRVVKTGGTGFDGVCSPYSPMLVVKATDTHGYISFGYNDYGRNHCYIGGGNADKINWSGILFHNNMSLIPKTDNAFDIGDSSYRWKGIYALNLFASALYGPKPSGGSFNQYRMIYSEGRLYLQAGSNDGATTAGIVTISGINVAALTEFHVFAKYSLFTGDTQVNGASRFVSLATFDADIKIGDATLTWDASAGMLKIDKGVYSIGAITAGGKGQSNKYRLDEWTEWDASDNKWLESSLSAKLGFELHSRLLAIEESANLGSVTIDLEYILGTPTLTPLQARAAGLTEDVINNLLSGKYTKVISSNALEVWSYTGYSSGSGISLYFTRGDGFIVQSGLKISRASINNDWIVNYNEI